MTDERSMHSAAQHCTARHGTVCHQASGANGSDGGSSNGSGSQQQLPTRGAGPGSQRCQPRVLAAPQRAAARQQDGCGLPNPIQAAELSGCCLLGRAAAALQLGALQARGGGVSAG